MVWLAAWRSQGQKERKMSGSEGEANENDNNRHSDSEFPSGLQSHPDCFLGRAGRLTKASKNPIFSLLVFPLGGRENIDFHMSWCSVINMTLGLLEQSSIKYWW